MADRPNADLPDRERPDRAELEELRDWETLQINESEKTERLRIVGGWLYRTVSATGHVAMVFVPEHPDDE